MGLSDKETTNGSQSLPKSRYETQFGPVPSQIEVEKAMSELQRLMNRSSTSNSQTDGLQQIMSRSDLSMSKSFGYQLILDAFHMLQTDPAIRRMVLSISSDKAVWDAISKNKAAREIQVSLNTALEERPRSYTNEFDLPSLIKKWIFHNSVAKMLELLEKFLSFVSEVIFQTAGKGKPTSELNNLLEEKLRSSFLLTVIVLLIVVVTRIHEN